MRIVDAHHHLWDLESNYYPWLSDQVRQVAYGDYSDIRRSYLPDDLLKDFGRLNIVKTVHVQAEWDFRNPVGETAWVQSVADAWQERGIAKAIVAHADFTKPDVAWVLDDHCRYPNVRGIRQMLHRLRSVNAAGDPLSNPDWRANLGQLVERKLHFELQIYPHQMTAAVAVVRDRGDLQFILNHAGCPVRDGAAYWEVWRDGLRLLAACPNVAVKISGLGMFDPSWSVESIRPFVSETIAQFGPDRCMFGSNYPVDRLFSSYERIWDSFLSLTKSFAARDQERMLAGTAEHHYQI